MMFDGLFQVWDYTLEINSLREIEFLKNYLKFSTK